MKQTDGPLSEGYVHIMHKKLRNFHFFERIFTIDVMNVRIITGLAAALGLVELLGLAGRAGFAARLGLRFGRVGWHVAVLVQLHGGAPDRAFSRP